MADFRLNQDENKDLGFGSRVAQQSHDRLLNRDGSFNVRREGWPYLRLLSPYHYLLTISWMQFNVIVVSAYLIFNFLFALGYFLCGDGALQGAGLGSVSERFVDDFFFSVQTSTTIGYGRIAPVGLAANILVSIEAMAGLLGFALATSLLFARFSKPNAKIIFSKHALIAPYRGFTAFEFRIANARTNQLIQVDVKVVLSRLERKGDVTSRKFYELALERQQVLFFPLNWTVVHPIDQTSPLFGVTKESFYESDPEFLLLLTGTDDTFSTTVHARSSYKGNEVLWGAKFSDMFNKSDNGMISVDLRRIHEIEPVQLPQ
jgi:inward rectifier potassium channel